MSKKTCSRKIELFQQLWKPRIVTLEPLNQQLSSFEFLPNNSFNTVLKQTCHLYYQLEMDTDICQANARAGLSESADSVDPLLAACAHNREFSLLLKLPDEILLTILQFLLSDIRDIYYVRRVCRKLRFMADDRTLEPRLFRENIGLRGSHMLHQDRFTSRENNRMPFGVLPWDAVPEFEATIRKQTLCKPCQTAHRKLMQPDICVFIETPLKLLHCAGCDSYHPRNAFSHTQRRPSSENRICIGREGQLQLCEHVSISWADIEAHLAKSSKERDFFKAVSDFHIMCKHPSHNFSCKSTARLAPSEASCNDHTRPCARLQVDRTLTTGHYTPISLVLCWKPYSSSKILTAPENGQIEATRLRELYHDYRKNAASFIVPGPAQTATPEMLCFNPEKCGHVLYRNGVRPQATSYERLCIAHPSSQNGPVTNTEVHLDEDHQDPSRFAALGWTDHYVEFNESRGQSGIYVYECDKEHNSKGPTRCLMTSYRRAISLNYIDNRNPGALNPSHQWFHAIDQDSYPSIEKDGDLWSKVVAHFDKTKSRLRCRDTACRNYYQSPGPWHETTISAKVRCRHTYRGNWMYRAPTLVAGGLLRVVTVGTTLVAGAVLYYFW